MKSPNITDVLKQVLLNQDAMTAQIAELKAVIKSLNLRLDSKGARPAPPTPPTPTEECKDILSTLDIAQLKRYAIKYCKLSTDTVGMFKTAQLHAMLLPHLLELHAKHSLPECNTIKSPKTSTEKVEANGNNDVKGVCSKCGKKCRPMNTMCALCENKQAIEALRSKQPAIKDQNQDELTETETVWYDYWVDGLTHKEIAQKMNIKVSTSQSYRAHVKAKGADVNR